MNITRQELRELSLSLGRGERVSKNLLEYLNKLTPADYQIAIESIKDIYGWDGLNDRIMHAQMACIYICMHHKSELSEEGLKYTIEYQNK